VRVLYEVLPDRNSGYADEWRYQTSRKIVLSVGLFPNLQGRTDENAVRLDGRLLAEFQRSIQTKARATETFRPNKHVPPAKEHKRKERFKSEKLVDQHKISPTRDNKRFGHCFPEQ